MHLRLLSLNTWGLPFGIAPDLPRRTEALGMTLARSDADVIALQEVWTGRAREHLRQDASGAGFAHAFFVDRSQSNAGLVVLSRWPFRARRADHYRVRGRAERIRHGDFWAGKGWLDLLIQTPAGDVRVVDTHLHASYTEGGEPDDYAGERMAQVVELAHGLRDSSAPTVAVGDFNMHEGSEEYAVWLALSGMTDVAVALDARRATVLGADGRWTQGPEGDRIDYAFVRNVETHEGPGGETLGITPLSLERCFDEPVDLGDHRGLVSDHAGLRAEFEIAPIPGSARHPTIRDPERRAEMIGLARARLEEAAERTRTRARSQTALGLTGVVASGAVGFAGELATRSRRGLLRTLVFAAPALGLVASGTTLVLGQAFTRAAAGQLDAVAGLLDDFERD